MSGSEEDVRRHIAGHRDEFENVPAEFVQETTHSEIISLGMYAKAEGVKIRKVSVRKVDANSPAIDEPATIPFSRNLLMVPAQKVLRQVTNLNFSRENSDPQENVAEVLGAKVTR